MMRAKAKHSITLQESFNLNDYYELLNHISSKVLWEENLHGLSIKS
jgi:hypothetical protein